MNFGFYLDRRCAISGFAQYALHKGRSTQSFYVNLFQLFEMLFKAEKVVLPVESYTNGMA